MDLYAGFVSQLDRSSAEIRYGMKPFSRIGLPNSLSYIARSRVRIGNTGRSPVALQEQDPDTRTHTDAVLFTGILAVAGCLSATANVLPALSLQPQPQGLKMRQCASWCLMPQADHAPLTVNPESWQMPCRTGLHPGGIALGHLHYRQPQQS